MGRERRPFLVVTGMHRSGTTLTGQILARCPGVHLIHEPLNREYGLSEVRHVYPCDIDAGQELMYGALLGRLLDGRAGCVRHVTGDHRVKALARAAVGGRTGLDVAKFRLRRLLSPSLKPLLKDPFAALLSRSLISEGSRVLALVRHPAAIWLGIKRMGWQFHYADFAYAGVFKDLGLPVSARDLDTRPEVEKFAWLWTAIYTYLEGLAGHGQFLLVRHEDLCRQPAIEVQRMASFFGLRPRRRAREFIARNMFAETVAAPGKRLHLFERNAAALPAAWHGRLGAEEEMIIRTVCGPLVERNYGRWLPL